MPQVLLAAAISAEFKKALIDFGYELDAQYDNIERQAKAVGIITSTKLIIDQALIDRMPMLQWIARLGSGLEIVDQKACEQKGIFVCNSPNGIADAVAEHAIAMLIDIFKNISKANTEVHNGMWLREPNRGDELSSKTIGIIGYGHTGQAFAKRLTAFGCKVIAYDERPMESDGNATIVPLATLYEHADIVSYHVPLNDITQNYYKAELFRKPHYLLNTSRGAIATTQAILNGFNANKLLGACLDVLDFEGEFPTLSVDNGVLLKKLLEHNVIITPHIAGYSHQAIEKMSLELFQKLNKRRFV
jgi:D-3-phosphoglycerate dehydrogenase / 2-oxoglutarate reductase